MIRVFVLTAIVSLLLCSALFADPQQVMNTDQKSTGDDIGLIVSGSINVDHIGPEAAEAVTKRVTADPQRYLQAFSDRFLGANFDANVISGIYPNNLFTITNLVAPADTTAVATALRKQLSECLFVYRLFAPEDQVKLLAMLPEEKAFTMKRLISKYNQIAEFSPVEQ